MTEICLCSQSHFISALTVVFVNSKSLSSLKIDDTPVDDPSLKVLVANNSDTLKLLKMSSCPHVSPAGTVCRSRRGSEEAISLCLYQRFPDPPIFIAAKHVCPVAYLEFSFVRVIAL